MSDVKQVKVDNWGIYFLQRLKHFFNRTDYCDLTLQFQDNAQLKVHRLVLSACTEYFELLERTCEMYEDCLVMPDDLQADVVVPIVNFMYTGHLEFRMDSLERLYQTSQILNMPVLTKLLESHRVATKTATHSYSGLKKFPKISEPTKTVKPTISNKRSYSKAFDNNNVVYKEKKVYHPHKIPDPVSSPTPFGPSSPIPTESAISSNKKLVLTDPRPTRYELPEELDNDNVFDNSFCNISYTCKPLMIHPETVKRYSSKHSAIFSEASGSKKLLPGTSTVDIVECKRIVKDDNIFDDGLPDHSLNDDLDMFQTSFNNETVKDSSQLFDQILDDGPKVTIETKDSKAASNLDHAKIISEVLKKYPHLVKSNKNIKLKILNTPGKGKKPQKQYSYMEDTKMKTKIKNEGLDYTYETDVIDSQQAAKLIAMGAENTKGPWICLICGTPGKALHFTSYYKFRRHLVEVHNEKPVSNICEYCGLRSLKRNYLQHHLYSQHGVEPPPQYNFPKCNRCNYIALTEGLLVKHKMIHKDVKNFQCNICSEAFTTTKQLLQHIQATGHKYSAEKKTNLQCIYCLKPFLRDGNLYAHLKTYHKKEAKKDGVIEDSDEEKPTEEITRTKIDSRDGKLHHIKIEASTSFNNEYEEVDLQYQIQQRPDGDIQLTPRKQHNVIQNAKQKILNPGFSTPKPAVQKVKPARKPQPEPSNFLEDISIPSPANSNNHNDDELVLIDNTEYIMRDNQLIPRKAKPGGTEYIISDMMDSASLQAVQPTTSMEYTSVHNAKILEEAQPSMVVKKTNINQPIQIVVSNEAEYKALMNSNHPILFDNGEANKTLTMLTTQHNTTMETATIDLNNTQSNDMMIIQEDFPLNVTEAVTTDNSNIVVVYSHPVDDQNKQFQILTTGGIGSQFVQSSAIITQNYETVTTTAASMNAHVLEPQADATWQTSIQADNQQVAMNVHQSQLINVGEHVEIKPLVSDNNDNINDLPEVHLGPPIETNVCQESVVNESPEELHVVNTQHESQVVEQEVVEESHNVPEIPIETSTLSESIIEQEPMIDTEPIQIPHDHIPEVLANNINQDHNEPVIHEAMDHVPMDHASLDNASIDHTSMEHATLDHASMEPAPLEHAPMETESMIEPQHESAAVAEIVSQAEQVVDAAAEPLTDSTTIVENVDLNISNTTEDQQVLPESQAYDEIVQINHVPSEVPEVYPKEAVEKIQNLTSEWSEDEYDVAEDVQPQQLPAPVEEQAPKPEDIASHKPDRLEETIENIQLEVQNHVRATTALNATNESIADLETEESETSITEDTAPSPEEPQLLPVSQSTVVSLPNDPQTQEKISSLLNDWEDNDSQEENNCDTPTAVEDKIDENESLEKNPKPDDNIKSLVSDWDEEDEEIKEA